MEAPRSSSLPCPLADGTIKLIHCPDQLSPRQKKKLQAYICCIKKLTDPKVKVTHDETEAFLSMVFHRWTTADPIPAPPKKRPTPKFEDIAVEIGVFTADVPIPWGSYRRKKASLYADHQTPPERKAGAPIYMRMSPPWKDWNLDICRLIDGKCRFLPEGTVQFRYHEGMCERVAKFLAMKQMDDFSFYQLHRFNVELAVFFCRRLILRFALGLLEYRPISSHDFYNFWLFRNYRWSSESRMDPGGRLLSLPRPGLFDLP
ncbi:hypothetical protein MGYG_04254 [Nannizzia gypsea CBS 118893]|uniref:Uncharacterized protein n=1 Tax=Arthroderma gypseum (strain ATCC MYA-4604 / CBS 118893) TaxID=535722 RepID=E4URZ3_ARTGP|nr:hypothetical protein MGYG_04254 [Nannizzia gypsea CBS 118893]EFR01250.1 hypothetical protein MGYG_04254 [Nannizzia gypsea CBS 118893]